LKKPKKATRAAKKPIKIPYPDCSIDKPNEIGKMIWNSNLTKRLP